MDAATSDGVTGDLDSDGIPDALDPDVDGDGLTNEVEQGQPAADADGIPNERDLDSDGDGIADRHEGAGDRDRDGLPNFVDPDSDGDGALDRDEAGDNDLETVPTECAIELPLSEIVEHGDGVPDYLDGDSDNDGVSDAEELEQGSDRCSLDTDGDTQDDLLETAYAQVNCITGLEPACGCVVDAACLIPDEDYYVVLPFGSAKTGLLELDTRVGAADLFFLLDTTASMGPTLLNIVDTLAAPAGILEGFAPRVDSLWFGGGVFDDFPFGQYGAAPSDQPFAMVSRLREASFGAETVERLRTVEAEGGGDEPESATEALYRALAGAPATYRDGIGNHWMIPDLAADCLAGTWGAACFRETALPIVVLFTDVCSHNGPPDDPCSTYEGITPEPLSWTAMVETLRSRGVTFVGVNTRDGLRCRDVAAPAGDQPCWFLRQTALATGSVDLEGSPLVFDLPSTGSGSFAGDVVDALDSVVTRVPQNITALARDGERDSFDARGFIASITPACYGTPETCWTPPPGLSSVDAVGALRPDGFDRVLPRTRLRFRIDWRNDVFEGEPRSRVFVAYLDVRGNGQAVLQSRQIYIVVPAVSPQLD